jgi:hypothetical protein
MYAPYPGLPSMRHIQACMRHIQACHHTLKTVQKGEEDRPGGKSERHMGWNQCTNCHLLPKWDTISR